MVDEHMPGNLFTEDYTDVMRILTSACMMVIYTLGPGCICLCTLHTDGYTDTHTHTLQAPNLYGHRQPKG